jgi:uncharacterized SAM-binding protein YcdF (DUF218 family)
MGFLALLAVAAIGWAVWSGRLQRKQLPPVLLALAGAFIAARGSLLIGVAALIIAAAWYRGLTLRLFGRSTKTSEQSALDDARLLLGVSRLDDAERIRERHRTLIAHSHPDAGGSDTRAADLNNKRR